MELKNAHNGAVLDVNRFMQDVSCITINVSNKPKGHFLDVFSSVNKSVAEFKADFFCPAHALFIAPVGVNSDTITL
jgi:hypothetical protein